MANNKDFEKDFKLPDTKALSEAYTEYLDSVTFGGKPIGEEKKKPEAVSMLTKRRKAPLSMTR